MKKSFFLVCCILIILQCLGISCMPLKEAGGVYADAHSRKDKKEHIEKYAMKFGTSTRIIKHNLAWIYFAEEWQGAPYRYGGINKEGVDCSALVQNAYRKIYAMKIPRDSRSQFKWSNHISKRRLKWGDLLFFTIESKEITHVGIYLCNGWFLHASTSKGVTLNRLDEKYFSKYYHAAGRLSHSQ